MQQDVQTRQKMCGQAHTCHRCLRMDSKVDFDDLEAWWESHKNDCRTEFYCNAKRCKDASLLKQRHITVCVFHPEINEKREAAFKCSLDESLNVPDIGLFYSYLVQDSATEDSSEEYCSTFS